MKTFSQCKTYGKAWEGLNLQYMLMVTEKLHVEWSTMVYYNSNQDCSGNSLKSHLSNLLYHCAEVVNTVKANDFLQWENCVFKEAWKTSVHRPSEALTPGSCVEKQVSDCTISGKGQGEKVSIPQFIWQDSCFEEVHFLKDNSVLFTKGICSLSESERQRQTEGDRDTNILNTTVSPSANTHCWGSQTLPTGNIFVARQHRWHQQSSSSPPSASLNGTWVLK